MSVSYRIGSRKGIYTIVYEYWSGVRMRTYRVRGYYNGGNITDFLDNNEKFETWFNYDHYVSLFPRDNQLELHF